MLWSYTYICNIYICMEYWSNVWDFHILFNWRRSPPLKQWNYNKLSFFISFPQAWNRFEPVHVYLPFFISNSSLHIVRISKSSICLSRFFILFCAIKYFAYFLLSWLRKKEKKEFEIENFIFWEDRGSIRQPKSHKVLLGCGIVVSLLLWASICLTCSYFT